MASKHSPHRFSRAEVEAQKHTALMLFMAGKTQQQIADDLTTSLNDDRTVSRMTAARRIEAAIEDMRPHDDWDRYRTRQLAELEVARRKLMEAIATWVRENGAGDLSGPVAALAKVQEREAKLIGLDQVDPLQAIRDAEAAEQIETRTRVQRLMMDPVAYSAACAALEEIEANIVDRDDAELDAYLAISDPSH